VSAKLEIGFADEANLAWAAFGSFPESTVILHSSGRVALVNQAWSDFARENGNPSLTGCGVGDDYLAACRSDAGPDLELVRQAKAGIKGVLWGAREHFELAYPCDSPTDQRSFCLDAWRISSDYSLVRHRNITEERRLGDSLPASREPHKALPRHVPTPSITKRQKEVLERLGSGESYRQISTNLGISEKTVDYHIKALKERFDCQQTIAIVCQATKRGLI